MILQGPPGTGKSAFAAAVADAIDASFVVYQCHSWTDADELFVGVDVQAAVAGDAESVRQEGVLVKVARMSATGMVVLLLDELDKAQERAEALLYDWLQTGRVPLRPGVHVQTNTDNVVCIITSNDQRTLSDALFRRAARVMMLPLPTTQQESLIASRTGLPASVVRTVWKLARAVANAEGNAALSVQEGARLASAAYNWAESSEDLQIFASQWAARTNKGREAIHNDLKRQVNTAWAEICRARKDAA